MSDTDDDECCQICLLPKAKLTMPCGHSACQNCLERIFLFTNPQYRSNGLDDSEEAIVSLCPTRGKCPFCRTMVNMFDLKSDLRSLTEGLDPDSGLVLTYSAMDNFFASSLPGASYRDREGTLSIIFPTTETERPFIVKNEKKIYFDHNVHYHGKSKTFTGSFDYKKDNESSGNIGNYTDSGEVIMQFSSDYRFVAHGAIITRKSFSSDLRTCPFDGRWKIRWQPASDREATFESLSSDKFRIVDNTWDLYGHSYRLVRCGNSVQFSWNTGVMQTVESGVDLASKPDGPDIGETIIWTVDDPEYDRITWTRETKGDRPPPIIQPLGNSPMGIMLLKQNCIRRNSRPTYHSDGPMGNVFIQSHIVGLASYHFTAPQSDSNGDDSLLAYISYENVACSSWPPLDDGSPVPAQVPFVNCSYDCDARIFRGKIPWLETYGTTWMGCKEWNYEMHFDSDFVCILSGIVESVTTEGRKKEMSKFGQSLIYVNAAIRERIEQGAHEVSVSGEGNSGDGDEDADDKIRKILSIRNEMKDRLVREGATNRTLGQIYEASLGATVDEEDPVDYNL